jgi:hypothetical protein
MKTEFIEHVWTTPFDEQGALASVSGAARRRARSAADDFARKPPSVRSAPDASARMSASQAEVAGRGTTGSPSVATFHVDTQPFRASLPPAGRTRRCVIHRNARVGGAFDRFILHPSGRTHTSCSTISCTRSAAKCVTPYLIGVPCRSTSTFSPHNTGCCRLMFSRRATSGSGSTLPMRLHLRR